MSCRPHWIEAKWVVSALLVALLLLCGVALAVGSASLRPSEVADALWNAVRADAPSNPATRIVLDTRLPRILLAILVGAGLAMGGLAAQTLFRNPLASPYIVGVSNGAALGAVAGILAAGAWLPFAAVPTLSVLAGLAVAGVVFLFARRGRHFGHSLLLAGIAISAFCSAVTAGTLYLAGERLATLVFWLMGGLWQANWRDVGIMLPVTAGCFATLTFLAPAMNVALVGERSSRDLGVHVRRLQISLLGILAITTAVAVSLTGVIGFIGLVVPHLLRLLMGADHRGLLPASALGGAVLLLAADTLARTVAAPAEIPVGILTALVGAPIFLWLLQRRNAPRTTA